MIVDYRGRFDHQILEELRELLLTKKPGIGVVEARVDTQKFAKKIETFAVITNLQCRIEKKEDYWSILLSPPVCKAGKLL